MLHHVASIAIAFRCNVVAILAMPAFSLSVALFAFQYKVMAYMAFSLLGEVVGHALGAVVLGQAVQAFV